MALIRCKECGKEISSNARACPHCGCPMELQEQIPVNWSTEIAISSEQAAEIIRSELENARIEIEEAEQKYDYKESELQLKASSSINLYSSTAASRAVDIAAMAKDMCDELYVAYQSTVVRIDTVCRPLLQNEPEASVIGEVAELIEHLNAESQISTSFSASLNQRDLGNFASSKYLPSLECRMIEKYWADAYRQTPEYQQRKQAEDQKNREEEAARMDAEQKARNERATYKSEYENWKLVCDAQEAKRKGELNVILETERRRLEAEIKSSRDARTKEQEVLITDITRQKVSVEAELAKIGAFRFAEKKAKKETIAALTKELEGAKSKLEQINADFRKEMNDIPLRVKEKEPEFRKEINEKYPIPPEPEKPATMTVSSPLNRKLEDEEIIQAIQKILSDGKARRVSELMEEPELCEYSSQRVSNILKRMNDYGELKREVIRNLTYFSIS